MLGMDADDHVFDENYVAYLLLFQESSVNLEPIEEHVFDPGYLMFLANLNEHGNSYTPHLPIQEDVSDPQYLIFLDNLKEHGNSYLLDVLDENGAPLRIIYEEDNLHFDQVMKRGTPKRGCEYNICQDRNNANKTHRRPSGAPTPHINSNRGESRKRKSFCSSSDEYPHGERHFAGMNDTINVRSYGVRNTLQKRPRCESEGKNSRSTTHVHEHEKRSNAKKTHRRLSRAPTTRIKCNRGESTKRKFSCSSTDEYSQGERHFAEKNDRRNVSSYGVRNTLKKRPLGESERKNSRSTMRKNNPISVTFADFQVKKKKEKKKNPHNFDHFQGGQTTEKNSPISVSFADFREKEKINPDSFDHFQDKQMMEKNNPISVSFADFQDKEKTEEKNPHSFDHFQSWQTTEKNNPISVSFADFQETEKINPDRFDHFRDKQMTEKNNPISVSFADFQYKEKTKKKNPISPNLDYFKEQCVNVIDNSRSAPKNSSIQKSVINDVYDLFLKNLKVSGESVLYKFGDSEQVLYELSSDRSLTFVAGSSNPPIKVDPPIKSNRRKRIAAESSDKSRRKIVGGLPLTVRVATEKQPAHPSTSSIPVSRSTMPSLTIRVATEKQPTHLSTSFIPVSRSTMPLLDKQLVNSGEVPHRVPTIMRKKLLEILSQPYNKQEHEQLWKELSLRSAVQKHRDSRSGGSHRPGQMGCSLLDWYPDLNSELDKVKPDPLKELNLLRMLSLYIMKLPCGNICKPWMDDSLMTIIHGSA